MTLKDKSRESARLANKLEGSGDYNLATNRFYYAVFQKTYHLAQTRYGYEYDKTKGTGSHKQLINALTKKISDIRISSDPNDLALNKLNNMTDVYKKLKDMREKADYNKDDITVDDLALVRKYYDDYNERYAILIEKS